MRQSFEMDTVLGLANLMADNPEAEVPLWSEYSATYDPDLIDAAGEQGSYVPNPTQPDGTVPILVDRYDGDGPYIVLTDYTVDDDPTLSDSTLGIQASLRAEGLDVVKGMSSDLFALVHGRWGGMLGPVRLVSAQRASGTNVGQDSNNRQGRVENYYLRVHRPSTNRQ